MTGDQQPDIKERQLDGEVKSPALDTPDAQKARNADANDVIAASNLNSDRHSGSAGGPDQEHSIEIVSSDLVVSRRAPLTERDLNQNLVRKTSISFEEMAKRANEGDLFAAAFLRDMSKAQNLEPEKQRAELSRIQADADRIYGRENKYQEEDLPVGDQAHEIAWNPKDMIPKWAQEAGREVIEQGEHAFFPFRGREDSQIDYTACAMAYVSFREFALHPNIDRALIPALIRNELHFYNVKERVLEGTIKAFGDLPKDSLSIGPAQIQKQHIERLITKFPQLSDPQLGNIKGNPLEAALNPAKAPWFVAALLAERIAECDAAKIQVTHQDLIQHYNPGGKTHFDNVHRQILWIKNHHAGW